MTGKRPKSFLASGHSLNERNKYACKRLIKRIKKLAEVDKVPLPEYSELEPWAKNAVKGKEYCKGTSKQMIYRLNLIPESSRLQENYGKLCMSIKEWKDSKGRKRFSLDSFYHGAHVTTEINLEEKEMLKVFSILKENSKKKHPESIALYPILDSEDQIVKSFIREGRMTIEVDKRFKTRTATVKIPDDAFLALAHQGMVKYLSLTGSTLLFSAMESDKYLFHWKNSIGKKQFLIAQDNYPIICEHALKAVKVITDSHGIAMIDRDILLGEERALINELFERWNLDVSPYLRTWFLTPYSKVLKKELAPSKDSREEKAKRLTDFLNTRYPMRKIREKLEIDEFSSYDFLDVVCAAIETAKSRRS